MQIKETVLWHFYLQENLDKGMREVSAAETLRESEPLGQIKNAAITLLKLIPLIHK
ncbi:MAG: hypothetical protein WBJ10_02435 [Daejeonella sp.]|uniref:hypothetical protein n=1 Tax=Daejeonella sp. TaxID=2805397 RepID=UPI003C70AFA1